jgi:hypothetical protein
MMEAVRASETSVYSNETTRRCIPEGFHLQTRRRENLKPYLLKNVDLPGFSCLEPEMLNDIEEKANT